MDSKARPPFCLFLQVGDHPLPRRGNANDVKLETVTWPKLASIVESSASFFEQLCNLFDGVQIEGIGNYPQFDVQKILASLIHTRYLFTINLFWVKLTFEQ